MLLLLNTSCFLFRVRETCNLTWFPFWHDILRVSKLLAYPFFFYFKLALFGIWWFLLKLGNDHRDSFSVGYYVLAVSIKEQYLPCHKPDKWILPLTIVIAVLDFEIPCSRPETPVFDPRHLLTKYEAVMTKTRTSTTTKRVRTMASKFQDVGVTGGDLLKRTPGTVFFKFWNGTHLTEKVTLSLTEIVSY